MAWVRPRWGVPIAPSRVQALGAGTMIGPDSDVEAIADAVKALLDERSAERRAPSAWPP